MYIFSQILNAQVWTTLPNCPRKQDHSTGFVIGSNFYTGTGYDSIYNGKATNKFFKYDLIANAWSAIANFPDSGRIGPISFAIGGKGYVGLGADKNYNCMRDLYEYDPLTNTWSKKADCPMTVCMYGGAAFELNNKGYVMKGADNSIFITEVYQYDPVSDNWVQKNNFPGNRRCDATATSANSKGYFGLGRMWNGPYTVLKDIWEYNDLTDTWTSKTNYPNGPIFWPSSLTHNNEVYFGGGGTSLIMKYNPSSNIWTSVPNLPFGRHASIGFSFDCNIYLCNGSGGPGNLDELIKLKVDSTCVYPQVGIIENFQNKSFNLFPNPTKDIINLNLNQQFIGGNIQIVDAIGKVLQTQQIKITNEKINLNLNSGIYFIKATTKDGVSKTEKLVVD